VGQAANGDVSGRNVILLMSDQHNPKVASVSGHRLVQTPNLDRMAASGVVFESCYCPSPLCMPCRSAFLSGRRVHEIQCYSNCNVFPFEYPSYGEVLHRQGIHTVHIGKVDSYRPAGELGFSEVLLPGDRTPPGDTEISRVPLAIRADAAERANGYGPTDRNPFEKDDRVIETALRWLREDSKVVESPWVLVIQLVKPHFPLKNPPELWELYPTGGDLPDYGGEEASANHPYALDLRAHFQTDQFTEAQIRGLRRGYLGCVTYVDRQLGRVLDALEETGQRERTLVAYTSDHGEMLGKFKMWWKSSLYEDSARVPLVVSGAGFERGVRVRTPVDLHDLRATIFDVTGSRQPRDWQGTSLQGIPRDDGDRVVFSEYHGHGVRGSGYIIRQGDWKLIHCARAPHQLFNLADDPEELDNLAEKLPEKLRKLQSILTDFCDPEAEHQRAEAFIRRQIAAIGGRGSAAKAGPASS
jgi:choline-sulfatase